MTTETLSRPWLDRLHQVLSGYIHRGNNPRLITLVGCHDDIHIATLGTMSAGQSAPMKRDTIFPIAWLTKPITAAAAMILVEECKLRLDASIETRLPLQRSAALLLVPAAPPAQVQRQSSIRVVHLFFQVSFRRTFPERSPLSPRRNLS
jgi:hypothetical protein